MKKLLIILISIYLKGLYADCVESYNVDMLGNIDSKPAINLFFEEQYQLEELGQYFIQDDLICLMGPENGKIQLHLNVGNKSKCPKNKFITPSIGIKNIFSKKVIIRSTKTNWIKSREFINEDHKKVCIYKMKGKSIEEMIWMSNTPY